MLRSRNTIDAAGMRARLDAVVRRMQREADGLGADPFDDAMVAALIGVAEALKDQAGALAEIGERLGKLARKT